MTTLRPSIDPASAPPKCRWLWAACAASAAGLYLCTCQSGPAWQDSGMHQWRVLTGDVVGARGLALAHPLYILVAQGLKLIPLGELPARLNAFSAIGMAVAVANLACLCAMLTGRRWIGAAIAGLIAVAHTPWWLATIAETYSWQAAGLTAELWLLTGLVRRPRMSRLVALAAVSGLGLSLHNLALVALPVYAATAVVLVARKQLPARSLALAAAAWLAGASVLLTLVVTEAVRSGQVGRTIVSALVGGYGQDVFNVSSRPVHWQANAVLAGMNFLSVLGPLAVIGWVRFRKIVGTVAWPLGALTVLEIGFVARYSIPDQFTFLLPSLMLIGVAAAAGLEVLARRRVYRQVAIAAVCVSVAAAAPLYLLAAHAARQFAEAARARAPYRDEARYWLIPWKQNEDSAERFARTAFAELPADAVVWPDNSSRWALRLVQRIDALRPDVTIQTSRGPLPPATNLSALRTALGGRGLFVVSSEPGRVPPGIAAAATFTRDHPGDLLLRVRWKTDPAGGARTRGAKP